MSVQTRFRWCTSTACFLPLVSAENIYSRAQSAGGGEAQSQHLGRMPKSSRSNLYCRMNGGNIALKCGKTAKNEWKEATYTTPIRLFGFELSLCVADSA